MTGNKIAVEFTREEIEILIGSIASSTPADKEHEAILFKLYYKLKFKLTDIEAR